MRILMLGNSFTFYNDMPAMLAELTGAEVIAHTRGGARLAEQLNRETQMGSKTCEALENETWDYVILQEQSHSPVTSKASFLKSVTALCEMSRHAGAVPVLYATWAYQKGSKVMEGMGMSYDEMSGQMSASYHEAAELNDALIADVGRKFYELADTVALYTEDGKHPTEEGSRIAAEILAEVILNDQVKRSITR